MAAFDLSTLSPHALIVIVLAAIAAGLARGFAGFGSAMIFIPLAATAVGPKIAAPLFLIIDILTGLGMIPRLWRVTNRRDVATMLIGSLAGIPAGTALLAYSDPLLIRWIVSILVFLFLALLLSGWRYRGLQSSPITAGVGAVSGFLSGLAQVGGPPLLVYWLSGPNAIQTVRANLVMYFVGATIISLLAYGSTGLLTTALAAPALVAAPTYAAAIFAGSRILGLASERTFRRVVYALIAMAGLVSLPLLDPLLR